MFTIAKTKAKNVEMKMRVFFKVPHLLPAVGVGLYSPTLTHYTHKTVQLKSPGNYSVQQDVKFNFVSTMHSKLSQAHWN